MKSAMKCSNHAQNRPRVSSTLLDATQPKNRFGSTPSGPPGYDSSTAHTRFMKACDYYKILVGTVPVGTIMAKRRAPRTYECTGLFVDPDYHNRGIASNAFEQVMTMYSDAQIWTLGTPEWNVRTKHFYEKLGFVQMKCEEQEQPLFCLLFVVRQRVKSA